MGSKQKSHCGFNEKEIKRYALNIIAVYVFSKSFFFIYTDALMDTVDESIHAICEEAEHNLSAGNNISEDMLDTIGQLPCSSSDVPYYYTVLNEYLKKLNGDPILSMLDIESGTLAEAFSGITGEGCSSKVETPTYVYKLGNF